LVFKRQNTVVKYGLPYIKNWTVDSFEIVPSSISNNKTFFVLCILVEKILEMSGMFNIKLSNFKSSV
jgi:hypothetical protein